MRTKTYGVKNIFDTQLSCMLFSFGEAAPRLCGKGIAPTNSIYSYLPPLPRSTDHHMFKDMFISTSST